MEDEKGGGLAVASLRFRANVSSLVPSTGKKPVLADTSGVGNSDLDGHPSRPSLASDQFEKRIPVSTLVPGTAANGCDDLGKSARAL